ncbi:MAG: homoserine kinase [Elusimicrobia bacterium]|nr:homoserine kinase [Elusimicrobiota bacterium]MBD3412484.1 homoserine kinase [Elusimicrobiota bacterium]
MIIAVGKKITVRVPATSANLGPGFDCLGCALGLYNTIHIELNPRGQQEKLKVIITGFGEKTLPRNQNNIIVRAVLSMLKKENQPWRTMSIAMNNSIPLARGLGSSAAAWVGGLTAARLLVQSSIKQSEDIRTACRSEGHPDNVVPAFFGGLCITRQDRDGIIWWRQTLASDLQAVVCIPDFEIHTPKARELMPMKYTRKIAVYTTSSAAFFVSAVTDRQSAHRDRVIHRAMMDKFHQPFRRRLVSGMDQVFTAAQKAGALGAALSGSGPAIIALVRKKSPGKKVGEAMVRAFRKHGVRSMFHVLGFDTQGVCAL